MLESGDNDRAIGKAGEISRFQILKEEWRSVTPSRRYTDPSLAKVVAEELMKRRVTAFSQVYRREPSDYEFYVLWNAPGQVLNRQVTRTVAERAKRFRNLCEAFNQPVRLYAAK
ncbi:MAG: hypothetical protein JWM16_5825 [Verrucomicrobiales bacterium]|nr:hypothetical protein [Verrucomicrobiales bacterium]